MTGHLSLPQLTRTLDPYVNPSVDAWVLLVIDNFDSFTFNLVKYFGQLGVEQRVFRNNEITPAEALALNPDRVLISPGPCSPTEAGVSLDMIGAFAGKKPHFRGLPWRPSGGALFWGQDCTG